MTRTTAGFDLTEALKDPGFTPGRRHRAALFDLLGSRDDELVERAEKTLARGGVEAAHDAIARMPTAVAPLRGRLVRVVESICAQHETPELRAFLRACLRDDDAKTRRNAVIALRRWPDAAVEEELLAHWEWEPRVDHRRSIAATLGSIGGARALALLSAATSDDAELTRITSRAVQMLQRTLGRDAVGSVRAERSAPSPLELVVRCRQGLELLCASELGAAFAPQKIGPGVLKATLTGALGSVFRARTMVSFGFALPPVALRAGEDIAEALARALGSDTSRAVVASFTEGRASYRIAWEGAGHRRAAVWKAAERAMKTAPWLVNDPTESVWQASVRESPRGVEVTLEPRKLDDPRFAWRTGDVPAASHPTVAAALARVAGVRADDVVWDPFAGSGLELVERALLGPFARMVGTDTDARALRVARANLDSAGVANTELVEADARTYEVRGLTLIVTNPPLGHRVGFGADTTEMLCEFVRHAAATLSPGGRMVWLSPDAERTKAEAERAGLTVTRRQWVDLGGLEVELQRFEKSAGRRGFARRR